MIGQPRCRKLLVKSPTKIMSPTKVPIGKRTVDLGLKSFLVIQFNVYNALQKLFKICFVGMLDGAFYQKRVLPGSPTDVKTM